MPQREARPDYQDVSGLELKALVSSYLVEFVDGDRETGVNLGRLLACLLPPPVVVEEYAPADNAAVVYPIYGGC